MSGGEGGLYVYALAARGLPRRMVLEGHRLRTVTVAGVDAVVEPGVERLRPTEGVLQEQHEIVVALARMTDAILPARFGSFVTAPVLRRTLRTHQPEIAASLALVRGRRQMTVRVFGATIPEPATAQTAPTGTAYLNARRARTVEPPEVRLIRDAVRSWAAAERVEIGPGGLRATVFHLVPARMVPRYRRAVLNLPSSIAPLQLSVSGPWPPFAFAPALF
jgi:hypothetical protein